MTEDHLPYDDEDEEASPEEIEGVSSIGILAGVIVLLFLLTLTIIIVILV